MPAHLDLSFGVSMKYINTVIRAISLIAGVVLFGLVTMSLYVLGVAKPWAWGMIVGAGSAMLLAVFMAFLNYRENVKFDEARSRVEGTILEFSLATVCNIGKNRRAYFFLTANVIRVFLWDKRPYLESTVRREEVIITYDPARPNFLTLVFEDMETLELIFPGGREMILALRENGYRVEEEGGYVR